MHLRPTSTIRATTRLHAMPNCSLNLLIAIMRVVLFLSLKVAEQSLWVIVARIV